MIDWTVMTDEELATEIAAGNSEKSRREVLAQAPKDLDKINSDVLYASGNTPESPWRQPTSAVDAYPMNWTVTHNGSSWSSTVASNVWEPGVSGWRELADGESPPWRQPTGAHDAYALGARVTHNGSEWTSTIAANVWEPGYHGWDVYVPEIPDPDPYPAWVQPLGAQDAYALGAEVTHVGLYWRSNVDANVWEPGAYGWDEFTPA